MDKFAASAHLRDRHIATKPAGPGDEQKLQTCPWTRRHLAPQVCVMHLQASQGRELPQALREEPSHVPIVDHAQSLQLRKATSMVTNLIEHVVVHREVL